MLLPKSRYEACPLIFLLFAMATTSNGLGKKTQVVFDAQILYCTLDLIKSVQRQQKQSGTASET